MLKVQTLAVNLVSIVCHSNNSAKQELILITNMQAKKKENHEVEV